jgi:hypothetical protein
MLIKGSRDINNAGGVKGNGLIYAVQNNHRLQKTVNRFCLKADQAEMLNKFYTNSEGSCVCET